MLSSGDPNILRWEYGRVSRGTRKTDQEGLKPITRKRQRHFDPEPTMIEADRV
jgi:hypothetical protein